MDHEDIIDVGSDDSVPSHKRDCRVHLRLTMASLILRKMISCLVLCVATKLLHFPMQVPRQDWKYEDVRPSSTVPHIPGSVRLITEQSSTILRREPNPESCIFLLS